MTRLPNCPIQTDRSLTYRPGYPHAETIGGMLVCPKCGSVRLVPLTFISTMLNDRGDIPRRPLAKCAACGKRIYAPRPDRATDK